MIAYTEPCSMFVVIATALSAAGGTYTTPVCCINTRCGSTVQAGQWPRWQSSQLTLPTCWRAAWVCTNVKNTIAYHGSECNIPNCSISQVTNTLCLLAGRGLTFISWCLQPAWSVYLLQLWISVVIVAQVSRICAVFV